MAEQHQDPNLTDDEKELFEKLMPEDLQEILDTGLHRRHFLKLMSLTGGGLMAAHLLGIEQVAARPFTFSAIAEDPLSLENAMRVSFKVNGQLKTLMIDPRMTLLDTVRERLGLTGSKKGCDHGQCGACTVLVNGRRVLSCLTLAATCESQAVVTIEGLADGNTLHPVQAAFIKHDGFQCGFCTPGQICSAVALLQEARQGQGSYVTNDLTKQTKSLRFTSCRKRKARQNPTPVYQYSTSPTLSMITAFF